MTDLRARQRELGRQAIVDAAAALVTERHHLDFAVKEVAERAGVSLRTVYNHFATREDLLDALGEEAGRQMREAGSFEASEIETLDDILDAVAGNTRVFRDLGGISEALAQMPLADVGRDAGRSRRTGAIVDHLAAAMPDTPAADAEIIAVMLRHLLSHRSWFWLTHEYGLTDDQFIRVVRWAVTTLTDAADAGGLPDPEEDR